MTEAPIYLDYNASAPLDPRVREAMTPYLETFGNSRSGHVYGARLRQAIETARAQVAELIGADPEEIFFTSGGSEANNLALKGLAWSRPERRHMVISALEHYSVTYAAEFLVTEGRALTVAPVDGVGRVAVSSLAAALRPDTLVVAVQHANNEIGTVQDMAAIAEAAHAVGALVHCDAAQSVGKLPVDVQELGADTLTLAGHKFCGPQGIGALYRRRGVSLVPLVHGAGHEDGLRSGTHAVALIVGLGAASAIARADLAADARHMAAMRDRLYERLRAAIPDLHLNGDPAHRLPHTLNVSFPGVLGPSLLAAAEGVAATTGAACHSGRNEPSAAMKAIGAPEAVGLGAVRLSLGRLTTAAEIDEAATRLVAAYRALLA
ncbi:MAG: cysteine desulfurase family protein [Candidatus Sericytochromatia bacterium]